MNRKIAPEIVSPQDYEYYLPDIQVYNLENGIPIYAFNDEIQPVMQVEWVFEAGKWYESQNGISQAVASLLKSGTRSKTSLQINEHIEQYGASLKAVSGSDWASITLSCLTKHLSTLLPLVYELLTDTTFPQNELDIYIQNSKQRLSVQLLKSDFIANRKIEEFLYGKNHPYGNYLMPEDFDAIKPDLLKAFLQENYSSSNCKIFMAGMFSEKDVKSIAEIFGKNKWNNSPHKQEIVHHIISATQKKHRIILNESSVQGSIRLACFFPERSHPDYSSIVILNTVLGGYFGSRLMSNVREEKGYTYGIHSMMPHQKYVGSIIITSEVGKNVAEAAIEEVYKEMNILKNEPIQAEELDTVKNYLLGNLLSSLNGSFQIIQRWKGLILHGFTKERFNNNVAIYKSIEAKQLQELANKYYIQEDFYELIVT